MSILGTVSTAVLEHKLDGTESFVCSIAIAYIEADGDRSSSVALQIGSSMSPS